MFCSRIVLPVRGGATISPRWPKPTGARMSITRVVSSVGIVLELDHRLRVERGRVVECRRDRRIRRAGGLRSDSSRFERAAALLALEQQAGLEPEIADHVSRDDASRP